MEIDGSTCNVSVRFKDIEEGWCTFRVLVEGKSHCDAHLDRVTFDLRLSDEKHNLSRHAYFVNRVIDKVTRHLYLRDQRAGAVAQPAVSTEKPLSVDAPDWPIYQARNLMHEM